MRYLTFILIYANLLCLWQKCPKKTKKKQEAYRMKKEAVVVLKKVGSRLFFSHFILTRFAAGLARMHDVAEDGAAIENGLHELFDEDMLPPTISNKNSRALNCARARDKNSRRNFGRKPLYKNPRRHPDLRKAARN